MMMLALISWSPITLAATSCTSSGGTITLPSVAVPPNATSGTLLGNPGQVTITFTCSGLPYDLSVEGHTATIQAGLLAAADNSDTPGVGAGIIFATNLSGVALKLTASPIQADDRAWLRGGPGSTRGFEPGAVTVTCTSNSCVGDKSGSVSETFTAQLVRTTGPVGTGTLTGGTLMQFNWYIYGIGPSQGYFSSLKFNSIAVTAPACSINAAKDFTVTLPNVSARTLAVSPKVAGVTAFSISLSGCPSGTTVVSSTFSAGNIDGATGYLKNTAANNNVEVQLLNGSGSNNAAALSPILLNQATAGAQNSGRYNVVGGAATMNYYAQYIASGGTPSAGTVTSTVQYTITYP